MGREYLIRLPWPDKALNQNARVHWSVRSRATKDARNQAWSVAMEAPRVKCIPRAHIFVEYYPKTYRMDVQNCHAMMKAYIDGIADAMGCDDKRFNIDFPGVYAGKSERGEVIFRIKEPITAAEVGE